MAGEALRLGTRAGHVVMGGAVAVADSDVEHPIRPEDHPAAVGAQRAFPGFRDEDVLHVGQAALIVPRARDRDRDARLRFPILRI